MNRTLSESGTSGRLRFLAALVAGMLALALPAIASAAPMRLFVDAGHGGHDPGAVAAGLREKDSNLRIARLVVRSAKRQGWAVGMSRNGDYFVPLNTRSRRANHWKASVFVSIHSNSTGGHNVGYMTIYRGTASRRLGQSIMDRTNKLTPYHDIGNRRDVRGLAVLRGARQPAVLVEAMSVTARSERAQLKDARRAQVIAEAIVRGIARFRHTHYVPLKPSEVLGANDVAAKSATDSAQAPTPLPELSVGTAAGALPPLPQVLEQARAAAGDGSPTDASGERDAEANRNTLPTHLSAESAAKSVPSSKRTHRSASAGPADHGVQADSPDKLMPQKTAQRSFGPDLLHTLISIFSI